MENNNIEPRLQNGFPNGRDIEAKERAEEALQAEANARLLTGVVQPAVGRVVDGISRGANVLQDAVIAGVGVASDKLVDKQDQLLEEGRDLIRASPGAAIGMAFGAGLLLSAALARL